MKTTYDSNKVKLISIILSVVIILSGCSASKTLKGGAIGAGAGGLIGGIIGKKSDNTAKGAIIGAMIGGTAGALIGRYMDKQAEELEKDLEGATIERVGEGIKITFDSGILFGFDSYTLNSQSETNLGKLALTLNKYEDTEILIEGHTDNVGDDSYNEQLSEKRANSVSEFLGLEEVAKERLITTAYGESQPVAENSTEEGRRLNRRVEVAIYANEKLKKAALNGEL
ncbi:MAG: OmpA family protein [Bacteroidota bacterium]